MSDEEYNGWSNRETWAVALHINNDQGWQESVYDVLREERDRLTVRGEVDTANPERVDGNTLSAWYAGEIIRENVENLLTVDGYQADLGPRHKGSYPEALARIAQEIGSLWRVDWTELGASFLEALKDES